MDTAIQQRLARNVHQRRVENGWSKQAFALLLGISRPELDLIEAGGCNLKLLNLEKIANRMGVEPGELLR